MRHLILGVFLAVATMAHAVRADLRVDFEGAFRPVEPAANSKGHIGGVVGEPLHENSSGWADVDMRFSQLTEGAFEGKSAQRIEVKAIREGRAQGMIAGVALPAGKYSKIRFAARAPAGGAVEVGLREQGPPYVSHWSKRFRLAPEWRVCEALIPPLTIKPGEIDALMIYFDVGTTDIDAIVLQSIDVDALVANAPKKDGNLLSASSFPMGLPSPWSISAGTMGTRAEADAAVPGPSGVAALKLTAGVTEQGGRSVEIVSGPIAANQCRPHTVSFDARGVKEGQRIWIQFAGPNGPSERRELAISAAWKRVSATFKLPYIVDDFMLMRIGASQDVWIDGVQLEEGGQASVLVRSGGDRLQVRATKVFGLSAGQEPMSVTYTVLSQAPAGTRIGGNLVDAHGRVQVIAPVEIASSKGSPARLELPDFKDGAYGSFRVELRLVDADGKPRSDWAEAVVHKVRPARMLAQDAPDSPFGVHIHPIQEYAQMVKMLGINWVRIHDAAAHLTKWYFLENKPDHFDFARADEGVKLFRDSRLMYCLCFGR